MYSDHVNTDMSFETLREICSNAWLWWKKCFMLIGKERDKEYGCYCLDFNIFIQVKLLLNNYKLLLIK